MAIIRNLLVIATLWSCSALATTTTVKSTQTFSVTRDQCSTSYTTKTVKHVRSTTQVEHLGRITWTTHSTVPASIISRAVDVDSVSTIHVTATSTATVSAPEVTITSTFTSNSSSTSTVAITASFTDVMDSTGEQNFSGTSKKREADPEAADKAEVVARRAKFPAKITCTKYFSTIVIVEIISVPASQVSSGATLTPTSAVSSQASVVSTTITDATTTTTPTFYAACSADNLLGPRDQAGNYLYSVQNHDSTDQTLIGNGTNAYDCCVDCINTPNCMYTQFIESPLSCAVFIDNSRTCNSSYQAGSVYVTTAQDATYKNFYYSNGYCGALGYNGVF